jgi:hypothetical protein
VGLLLRSKDQRSRSCLSVTPFLCDNLSFLGPTGLKLDTQVAYVRGRCGIAIEVNRSKVKVQGQGHGCPLHGFCAIT